MKKTVTIILLAVAAIYGYAQDQSSHAAQTSDATSAIQASQTQEPTATIQASPVISSTAPIQSKKPAQIAQPNPPYQSGMRKSPFPMLKDGSSAAFIAFTQPKQTHGLIMNNPDGVTYDTEDYLGRRGVKPGKDSKEKIFYFQAAKDQLITATGTFFVTVTFLDKGQGALSLEYRYEDGNGNKQSRSEKVFLGDSGIWQQHSFTLAGATLDRSFAGETDFRIECPEIMIHAVALSRMPIAKQEHATSTLFRQTMVTIPAGYEIGVMLTDKDNEEMWDKKNANLLEEKTKLYAAWGASYVIDTVNAAILQTPRGTLDFSLYAERAIQLSDRGLLWMPRFAIGDVDALPLNITNSMQKAVGTDRPKSGPMISLWEPRLTDFYAQIFDDMRKTINPQKIPQMMLSFAGDWGPLFFSADASNQSGWPDFWAGDPLAYRSFQDYLQRRYGNINALRAAWKEEAVSWNAVTPGMSPDFSASRKLDTYTWYRESLLAVMRRIVEKAKLYFPQTQIVLEIAEDFEFSATDPTEVAALASETNSSVAMITRDMSPAASALWLEFANACQRRGVKFGIHTIRQGGGKEMLSTLYSLASEGGSILCFSENFLVGDEAWTQYSETIPRLRYIKPNSRIALVFPRTSLTIDSPLIFNRMVGELRELFGFDVIDETGLSSISSTEYPFIFVPWGAVWSSEAIANFERLARGGSALVAHTDKPWQTVRGDVAFNETLFAVELAQGADGWRLQPRRESTRPYDKSNPVGRTERREIGMGTAGDDVFLEGQWGKPQNEIAAKQYGMPFKSFRWMGERGSINLPMRPGKEYQLQLEGFIPPGKWTQIYVNDRSLGGIIGNGQFRWSHPITGKLRSRDGDVNVFLRGQLWSMGEVLGATQSQRVSLALSKVSVVPLGEKPEMEKIAMGAPARPDFQRESLRGSWLREVGQGVTVIAPDEYVNEWVFREMLNSVVMQPILLDARYRFTLPADGQQNDVFVKSLIGNSSVYLNLSDQPVSLGGEDRSRPARTIPPNEVFYSN